MSYLESSEILTALAKSTGWIVENWRIIVVAALFAPFLKWERIRSIGPLGWIALWFFYVAGTCGWGLAQLIYNEFRALSPEPLKEWAAAQPWLVDVNWASVFFFAIFCGLEAVGLFDIVPLPVPSIVGLSGIPVYGIFVGLVLGGFAVLPIWAVFVPIGIWMCFLVLGG